MFRVFQIGFHICGTRSLCEFFSANNFQTFHHYNGKLSEDLFKNLAGGKTHFSPELEGPFNGKIGAFYSDMENFVEKRDRKEMNKQEGYKLFKEIHNGYPDALFILNVRNDWTDSKLKKKGFYKHYTDLTEDEKRKMLDNAWAEHLRNVRSYFRGRKEFLEFNIQDDKITKIVKWLESFGIEIKSRTFKKIRG